MTRPSLALLLALLLGAITLSLRLAAAPAASATPYGRKLDVPALTEIGRALFFDPSLSASGRVACASCHDPRFAFGPPNDLAVQLAGRDGRMPGLRAGPSLRYLQTLPPFSEHFFDNDGDDSVDAGPTGGHTWDGRASSGREQARLPLLSPLEMANASAAEVAAKLRHGAQAARLKQVFGEEAMADDARAFDAALLALEVFQQSPAEFYPYSSRYDEVLRGKAQLTAQEARGLALFNDPAKGNCAACHLSQKTPDGAFPLFTDFGLIALGVPRNRTLPANADPRFFDLGLCGPLRTDFQDRPAYCGLFRTPSLRNVALRRSFFHNGQFHTLDEVLRFYARRDTHPAEFYPPGQKFDDLPPAFHGNVNTEPPFDRHVGDKPALDDAEIAAIVAFLQTLTDADLRR
ncbi:c-type cytochrome [Ideonella azotifigens]|uniref:Cytochrome c peroxidase n=2 Tax=Ideonella azotifigens TaxID=513160 RepID=A0ABN1KB19_9BURK|nr:cytochrome c peroxidase [Ideonella azotifigens]MCD2344118.1 c-type cytochrome [Ideonella azotifigens]